MNKPNYSKESANAGSFFMQTVYTCVNKVYNKRKGGITLRQKPVYIRKPNNSVVVTINEEALKKAGLEVGDLVYVEANDNGEIVIKGLKK